MSEPTGAETRKAVSAAVVGNVLEWYDFAVYAFVATIIAKKFFPAQDEVTALLSTFLAYGLGFVARPLGGIVIGRLGDTRGRKTALLITIFLMAAGTVLIGLLPTYETIGVLAPLLLVVARLMQGFSAGGEWGGSTAYIVEWAPAGKRGWYGSFQQTSVVGGLLLGSGVAALLNSILDPATMEAWGWRVPFLLGGILGPVGMWMRREIDETPAYRRVEARGETGQIEDSGWLLAARAFGFTIVWTVCFYVLLNYMPTWTRQYMKLSPQAALWANTIGLFVLLVGDPLHGPPLRPAREEAAAARLLRRLRRRALAGVQLSRLRQRLLRHADPGAGVLRAADLDVLRSGPGGDRRDLPDQEPLDLDDLGLCARGRDLRRLRAADLGMADQGVRLADGAFLLPDRRRDRVDDRHRDAAGNRA